MDAVSYASVSAQDSAAAGAFSHPQRLQGLDSAARSILRVVGILIRPVPL
jgi:hypothetical protein